MAKVNRVRVDTKSPNSKGSGESLPAWLQATLNGGLGIASVVQGARAGKNQIDNMRLPALSFSEMFGNERRTPDRDGAGAGFTSASRAKARADELRSRKAGVDDRSQMTDQFSKYLSMAEGFVPGGSDWGALEQSLRGRAGEHDAKLAAMYKALEGAIQQDAPKIAGIYDEGISAVDESAQQATQAIMEGYEASRQAQTDQMIALGLQDSAAGLAADGGGIGFAAQDQGQATERVADTNQTSEDALTRNKTAALNYNTGIGNAAQLGGIESRGQLQNSLTDALSQMAFAQSQESSQRQAQIYEIAMQIKQDTDAGYAPDPKMLQALAEFNAEQQQTTWQNQFNTQKQSASVFQNLLKQTGNLEQAQQAYAEMQAAGFVP